jgi:ribosomal protein S18 acetylase RimI-like enzyme
VSEPLAIDLDPRQGTIAEEIRALLHAAYRVEGELLGVADFPPLARTAATIRSAPATFHGLREGERLVAVTEIEAADHGGRHIASLGVHPDRFRRGLARTLLRQVLGLPPPARFTVSTGALNAPALRLYRQLGFVEERRWLTPRESIPMVTLVRELPPA